MKLRAFTLIELLIVVAIIAILAAIAVPNFLEAQTRAKVSRVKADFRTVKTAQESYFVDYGTYTPNGRLNRPATPNGKPQPKGGYINLSTPIAYMTLIPLDPFGDADYLGNVWPGGYWMLSGKDGHAYAGWSNQEAAQNTAYPIDIWYISSAGPDRQNVIDWSNNTGLGALGAQKLAWFPIGVGWGGVQNPPTIGNNTVVDTYADEIANVIYDPTNGTTSFGEICASGGTRGYTRTLQLFRDLSSK